MKALSKSRSYGAIQSTQFDLFRRSTLLSFGLISLLMITLGFSASWAKSKKRKKKVKKKTRVTRRVKQEVTIPIDIGLGPAGQFFFGPMMEDQPVHWGFRLNLEAIIDQATIKKFKHKIPKKYRSMVSKIGEVRFRPFPLSLLPKTFVISPGENTSTYGTMWELYGLGGSLGPLKLGINLELAYLYINSNRDLLALAQGETETQKETTMHFLRPGIGAYAYFLFNLGESSALSLGWRSHGYLPQKWGGGIMEWSEKWEENLMHIGQAFVMFHYRLPYTTRL